MLAGLITGGYSVEEYEAEISSIQDAFTKAVSSAGDASVAGLAALQSAFPSAGFNVKDGVLQRASFDHTDRSVLDDVLRSLLMRTATEAVGSNQAIMTYSGASGNSPEPVMQRLLAIAKWITQACAAEGAPAGGGSSLKVIDLAGYCRMLEDLLELGTIGDCTDMFACMEADLAFLTSESAPKPASAPDAAAAGPSAGAPKPAPLQQSQLAILRACNSLMRRLSKANDVQLCGRILVFIARVYPLSDKSGLNLHGGINAGLPLPLDEVAPDALDVSAQPVDVKLYAVFWGLQNAFKAPSQLLQPSTWAKFRDDLSAVLDAFGKLPITVPASGPGSNLPQTDASMMDVDKGASSSATAAATATAGSTSVKYLTSSKLFGLQVRDANFRRHFLVQCAALVHFMRHPTSKDVRGGSALAPKADGLDALEEAVYAALAKTEGKKDAGFTSAVRGVIESETEWVAWKKDGCPPFERSPEALAKPLGELGPGSSLALAGRPAKRRRGPPRPTFAQMIAEPAVQMAGLKAEERKNMPDVRAMLQPIITDMDPEECIEDVYRRKNDKIFAWKAARMLARSNLPVFASCKDDLEEAVMRVYPEVRKKIDDHKAEQAERLAKIKEEEEREEKEEKEKEAAAAAAEEAAARGEEGAVEDKAGAGEVAAADNGGGLAGGGGDDDAAAFVKMEEEEGEAEVLS